MTRDQFREAVFARDDHRCVVCQAPAQDAHHIMERRLWPDGGHILENGASLCAKHHLAAERTDLSCEALRDAAGIGPIVLPPHLYPDQPYDKWGNPVLPNGTRLRGELFFDESVQKALAGVLSLFTNRVKYPRTYHLPWSPGATSDDRKMVNDYSLTDCEVIVTLKMDGENTTMYRDSMHARSLIFEPHPSRDRVRAAWGHIAHDIPEDWRVCGENLYAKHSVGYSDLEGYFLVFSVWNEKNVCLAWRDTVEWAALLGLPTVPVIYQGQYDREKVERAFEPHKASHEGYVIRWANAFTYSMFPVAVGKWVRPNHVQTHGGWMRQRLEANGLRGAK
ncbi:MAG: RNA ligase family protein [Elusimicrobiota bacterium]|jgi:hypothetical protein